MGAYIFGILSKPYAVNDFLSISLRYAKSLLIEKKSLLYIFLQVVTIVYSSLVLFLVKCFFFQNDTYIWIMQKHRKENSRRGLKMWIPRGLYNCWFHLLTPWLYLGTISHPKHFLLEKENVAIKYTCIY